MSNIEQIMEAMAQPSLPTAEVITLERRIIERALNLLESHPEVTAAGLPSCEEISVFRQALAEPKVELWAIHSVGPGEEYPCLNKEDAERRARDLRETGEQMKQERIARGESVALWNDWITNVIPSPWEPAEHFEIMAHEWVEDSDDLREHAKKLAAENETLRSAAQTVLNDLNARIDESIEARRATPIFEGIAELHDALHTPPNPA